MPLRPTRNRFTNKGHEIYTTTTLLEAESRLLEAGRQGGGPGDLKEHRGPTTAANLPGRDHSLTASTRPWQSSGSPPRVARLDVPASARPGRANPPRWRPSAPRGKPNTGQVRCSGWPPLRHEPVWPASSASTPRTRRNGSTSTARRPSGCARWRRFVVSSSTGPTTVARARRARLRHDGASGARSHLSIRRSPRLPTTTRGVLYVSGTRGRRATRSMSTPSTTPTRRPRMTKRPNRPAPERYWPRAAQRGGRRGGARRDPP